MDKTIDKIYKAKNKKPKRVFIIVLFILFFVLIISYASISYYYTNHFYKNTYINGQDASNKTIETVKAEINDEMRTYTLTLEGRNDLIDVIYGYNIGIKVVFDDGFEELLINQKGYDWPKYLFTTRDIEVETMIEVDEDLLNLNFEDLKFFDEELLIEPVDAYISEYNGNNYEIITEEIGNIVKKDVLYNSVVESIKFLEPTLSLEDINSYEEPNIRSDNPELVRLLNDLNDFTRANIVYEFGDVTEVVDGSRISEWLVIDDYNQVNLDPQGVKDFVDYIGKTYNTFGKTRTLKTSYGQTIEVKGGDYGWWLNRGKEVHELTELIIEGANIVKEPSYLQTAAQYGEDDVGDTYVEVNITAQHLYFYKDGKLVVESDFVSGNLSKGYVNPLGTFPVQYKEKNAILSGEDYSSPVDYWMPFYGDIGFHDASWRNKFGKNIYKTNGSHGCINMPRENAKKMYENIERGVAVFVYELPGTEN